jgi:uncharacterized protein (TIGR01615 family)
MFAIARPCAGYAHVLDAMPDVFVGSQGDLERLVQFMCGEAVRSFEAQCMAVPPWREAENVLKNYEWVASEKDEASVVAMQQWWRNEQPHSTIR